MTIARKLRDAAMGPAPIAQYMAFATRWLRICALPVGHPFSKYSDGDWKRGYLNGLTEDECRAFLYLLSMVVRDEK